MAHDIEHGGDVAYFGQVPWHGLGAVLADPYDLDAAVRAAGLDWTVAMGEGWCRFPDGSGVALDSDVCRPIYREDTRRVFGVAKGRYCPIQNADVVEPLRGVLESKRGGMSCLAALAGGRDIFACVQLARGEVCAGDPVDFYLLVTSSHDGSSSFRCYLTAVRVVCRNTLNMSLGSRRSTVTIRHTQAASDRLAALGEALASADDTIAANLDAWAAMGRTRVNDSQVQAFVAGLLPLPEQADKHPRALANVQKGRAIMLDLFECGDGADLASARGTVWGLYQAATAYASHVQRAKQDAEARLFRMTEGSGAAFVQRAEGLALAMVA